MPSGRAPTSTTPRRSNCQATLPSPPKLPPWSSKMRRTIAAVRFRLSVSARRRIATPPGPYPSYVTSMYWTPSRFPEAFLIARSMLSLGMFAALARSIAAASVTFVSGLGSCRAQTMISRVRRENKLDLFLSCAPLRCLMFAHFECPAITPSMAE